MFQEIISHQMNPNFKSATEKSKYMLERREHVIPTGKAAAVRSRPLFNPVGPPRTNV